MSTVLCKAVTSYLCEISTSTAGLRTLRPRRGTVSPGQSLSIRVQTSLHHELTRLVFLSRSILVGLLHACTTYEPRYCCHVPVGPFSLDLLAVPPSCHWPLRMTQTLGRANQHGAIRRVPSDHLSPISSPLQKAKPALCPSSSAHDKVHSHPEGKNGIFHWTTGTRVTQNHASCHFQTLRWLLQASYLAALFSPQLARSCREPGDSRLQRPSMPKQRKSSVSRLGLTASLRDLVRSLGCRCRLWHMPIQRGSL